MAASLLVDISVVENSLSTTGKLSAIGRLHIIAMAMFNIQLRS